MEKVWPDDYELSYFVIGESKSLLLWNCCIIYSNLLKSVQGVPCEKGKTITISRQGTARSVIEKGCSREALCPDTKGLLELASSKK